MSPDFESPTHEALNGVPPGWYIHEVKIRVFNLAKADEEAECSKLLTQLAAATDPEKEQLVSMSVAPRPVYTDAEHIFLDITWAVLRPIKQPVSAVVPVTSDRRESADAADVLRASFAGAANTTVTPPSKPVELDLD